MTKTLFRSALVVSALGAVTMAHAYIFVATGACDSNGIIQSTVYEHSSLAEFGDTFTYGISFFLNGDFQSGFANGPASVTMSGTGGSVFNAGNSYSFAGTFTVDTAAATSIQVGSHGTYTGTFDLAAGNYSFAVAGDAVPEPASMAVLGLGVAALVRRKLAK